MTQDPTRPLVWPATLAELTARFGAMLEAAGSLETGEFEAAALAREAVAAYRRWLRAEMEKLIMVNAYPARRHYYLNRAVVLALLEKPKDA